MEREVGLLPVVEDRQAMIADAEIRIPLEDFRSVRGSVGVVAELGVAGGE